MRKQRAHTCSWACSKSSRRAVVFTYSRKPSLSRTCPCSAAHTWLLPQVRLEVPAGTSGTIESLVLGATVLDKRFKGYIYGGTPGERRRGVGGLLGYEGLSEVIR